MLQKTLLTVGASLTAVVLLLFMIQRKKPRPAGEKSSGSKKGAGQANNNEVANASESDINNSLTNDSNVKVAKSATVSPNGVVVKTVGDNKTEESPSVQTKEKGLDSSLKKLSDSSSAEQVCLLESSCGEKSLKQENLVQPQSSSIPVTELSFTKQNAVPGLASDLTARQQITATDEQEQEVPEKEDDASGCVDECSIKKQQRLLDESLEDQGIKHVNGCSVEQDKPLSENLADVHQKEPVTVVQNDSKMLDESPDIVESPGSEEPVPTSIEELKSGNDKLVSNSTELEQNCGDTENGNDADEGKLMPMQATCPEKSIENNESLSSKESAETGGNQVCHGESCSVTNSKENDQSKSEQSNGGPVQKQLQLESEQSIEEPTMDISHSEMGQANGEPLQVPAPSQTESHNGKFVEKDSHSESGTANGEPLQLPSRTESESTNEEFVSKASHSVLGQSNGESLAKQSQSESIKQSDDAVEHPNKDSNKPTTVLEYYYNNHKAMLPTKPPNSSRRGDYRKIWLQPEDGLVFVKSSAGQPLVPQYLRDTDYLSTRTIPAHDPTTTAFLYSNMNKLMHPPENWVRVISVSDNLELRVRHDERDMLLEHLEKKGICDPHSKPPPPRLLTVGSLVAAHLDVPRRGRIWCRAHITAVVPVTGPSGRRKGRQPQPQHQPQPLYMVESVDHFPAASAEPVRASDLRSIAAHALHAPFYDQLLYLVNTMPANAVEYGSSARDLLLEQLRAGQNFLRVTGPCTCTHISGTCYWMASLASMHSTETSNEVCLLEEKLQKSEHAMPIYTGRVVEGLPFDKCIFWNGEAFWSDDDRCPSSLVQSCGLPNPQQEYLWLRRTDARIIQAFRGFKLPYMHAKYHFKCLGFNMSLHEYYTVYRHHSSTVLLTADPDKVLKVVLDDPKALIILDFHMQTLIRFYHFDPALMNDPTAHVAKDNVPLHMVSFPKDDNGFLILGNNYFSDFTKENLRIPIMPF